MGSGSLPKTHKEEEAPCSYLKPSERGFGGIPGLFVYMGFGKLVSFIWESCDQGYLSQISGYRKDMESHPRESSIFQGTRCNLEVRSQPRVYVGRIVGSLGSGTTWNWPTGGAAAPALRLLWIPLKYVLKRGSLERWTGSTYACVAGINSQPHVCPPLWPCSLRPFFLKALYAMPDLGEVRYLDCREQVE